MAKEFHADGISANVLENGGRKKVKLTMDIKGLRLDGEFGSEESKESPAISLPANLVDCSNAQFTFFHLKPTSWHFTMKIISENEVLEHEFKVDALPSAVNPKYNKFWVVKTPKNTFNFVIEFEKVNKDACWQKIKSDTNRYGKAMD